MYSVTVFRVFIYSITVFHEWMYSITMFRLFIYSITVFRELIYSITVFRELMNRITVFRLLIYSITVFRVLIYSITMFRELMYSITVFRVLICNKTVFHLYETAPKGTEIWFVLKCCCIVNRHLKCAIILRTYKYSFSRHKPKTKFALKNSKLHGPDFGNRDACYCTMLMSYKASYYQEVLTCVRTCSSYTEWQ